MNAIFIVTLLSQLSQPPLLPAEDTTVRRPAQPHGPSVPLETVRVRSEPQPEPEQRRLWELAAPAAAIALGSWFVSGVVVVGSCSGRWFTACQSASIFLIIPQLGPWMAIAAGGSADPWFGTNLALGVAQTGGLLAMITGMIVKVPVSADGDTVSVMPTGNGVALSGSF